MSFLSYLINGVSLGSIYAIIALGYRRWVSGIAKMLNFVHGDVIMIGVFVMLSAQYDEPSADPGGACGGCGVYRARCCGSNGFAYRPLPKCGVSAGNTDHCNRCQLSATECCAADFGANTVSFPNKITLRR